MTLIELEEQLKRMRKQSCDDDTMVRVVCGDRHGELKEVLEVVEGSRKVELIG